MNSQSRGLFLFASEVIFSSSKYHEFPIVYAEMLLFTALFMLACCRHALADIDVRLPSTIYYPCGY